MKCSIILPCLVTAFVALSPAGVALADNPHPSGTTGQPNKEASEEADMKPPGFSSGGFANAEQHYAGSALNPNMGNTDKAVSQYDVAGFQWQLHHPLPPPP
jgi:hypothetical protein